MKSHLLYLCAAVAALGLLPSCQTGTWDPLAKSAAPADPLAPADGAYVPPPPPGGLALSPESRFKDVPLPVNVKEDFDRTYVFDSNNIQVGRMVYTSRASVNEIANFYIAECKASGWTLKSAQQAEGAQELLFAKPGKQLAVTVRERSNLNGNELILNLTPTEGGF